ncbi:hypothetical protein [Cardinium endosymbiont of Bemisia tabaci]|uniref:hypothetical protein n=1 Tax=Cardinium endosymbiont of Bemisia tabaci TaxID=672794 RepID=UPI001031942C|nr:hypothetical protein [Cardinium endosymbiont of Bemisia tabaci]
MKSKKINNSLERLFEQRLSSFLNPKHPLFQLSDSIPFHSLASDLGFCRVCKICQKIFKIYFLY